MSEKSDQFLAAIETIMKIKLQGQTGKDPMPVDNKQAETSQSGVSSFNYTSIKSALETLLKMKEQGGKTNEGAEEELVMENKQSAEPQSSPSEPDYIPPQSVNSYSPKQEFSWQNEARIAYNPARPRPVRQERTSTPSLYSWPADRRRERRGAGQVFHTPTYRYREERFAFDGKSKNSTEAAPASGAQPIRTAGRDASVGRADRAQYGF